MAQIAFTLRIGSQERNALKHLSKIERRPINQLLNEAIKNYLREKGERERGLEASLAELKAYRKKDTGFRQAIAKVVDAEATVKDPLEGEPFEGPEGGGSQKSPGPVQDKLREVLGA